MDDDYQAWFERTWKDREDAIWDRYGPSHPSGSVEGHAVAFPSRIRMQRPGACTYVFRPCAPVLPMRIARNDWTYATHGLTQPLDERTAPPGTWELAVKTDAPVEWAHLLLLLILLEIIDGADFGWGHRIAFFLAERDEHLVPYLGAPEQHEGVTPVGSLRWLLLWPDLRPWGRIPCETGTTGVLVATALTQDEFDRLDDVNRCGHHLQLLLCERGVHQVTQADRASVLRDPAGREAWDRIRCLTAEDAYKEVVTRFTVVPGDESWPFEDPPNVATYTVRPVMNGDAEIVFVTHDVDDGAWQFLDSRGARQEDAALVSLREVVRRDPSIGDLARLPRGWSASRASEGAPWRWRAGP